MMKIKTDEAVYNLPINNGICNIAGPFINNLIECLDSYFIGKKKNKCVVIDDEGDLIKNNDVEFIYIPEDTDIEQILEFKPKTILNNELCLFIDNNQEKFTSIDKIRNLSYELLSDSGFYKLLSIMKSNTSIDLSIELDDFDVSRLLQMLSIKKENLTIQEKFIILYNLLLYENRNKYCIVYVDFPIDDIAIDWLGKIRDDNKIILINNTKLETTKLDCLEYMLILSNNDFVDTVEENINIIYNLSYCFHPYVLRNIDQQNEKNIKIINKFSDSESTFLIKFAGDNTI